MEETLEARKPKVDFNLRRKLYRKYRLSGMCMYDSAIKAGYSRITALANGKRLDEAGNIRTTLVKMGVTDDFLVQKMRDGMEAERPVVCDKEIYHEPDHAVRHKYVETALKLKGHLEKEVALTGITNIQVNFNLVGENGEGKGQDNTIELPSFTEAAISPESTERPEHS